MRYAIALFYIILRFADTYVCRDVKVGPTGLYATPWAAIAAANTGDVIEIDAAGNYTGDVCTILASSLTIRGVNGRPLIDAGGNNAQGKGTW